MQEFAKAFYKSRAWQRTRGNTPAAAAWSGSRISWRTRNTASLVLPSWRLSPALSPAAPSRSLGGSRHPPRRCMQGRRMRDVRGID